MANHILYVPGLGNQRDGEIQSMILKRWGKFGVQAHFVPINWRKEDYQSILERVINNIDSFDNPNDTVSLIGVSAGASMAVNAYMARKDRISGVVFICGKLRNPGAINPSYFERNPAFKKSVFDGAANVKQLTDADKAKMMTVQSCYDGLIPGHDSRIVGMKNRILPMILHVPTIYFAITLFKRKTIKFLRARAE